MEDPKSYRPISLLCVPYKILERLIYARVEPLIDPLLPKEQAGFRRVKSTVDQVVLLTQNIEDFFEAKKKAGGVFVNLTAAYDTVWHRGLTCKLLRLLLDKHMVKMIMELVRNRSFTLIIGDSKRSTLRRLKNGVPQGSQRSKDPDAHLCQLRGIFWTTLPDLLSAPLNGQITNGTRSTVKMLPGSVLLCPGPMPGLLGWAYPEQLG